jgi:hypothetical protein
MFDGEALPEAADADKPAPITTESVVNTTA